MTSDMRTLLIFTKAIYTKNRISTSPSTSQQSLTRISRFTTSLGARLFLRQRVRSSSEHSVATREGLSSSTNTLQNLAARQTLVTAEVNQEVVQITVEAVNLADSHKREDSRLAIRTLVELELLAANSNGGNCTAGAGDRARAAQSGQPDHDFIIGRASGGGAGEDVVRDVGDNGATGIAPGPGGR